MDLRHVFRKLKMGENQVSDDDYELSRRRFIVEGCLANSVYTLTSGAFLVGYASYLGANDQFNGIIMALPLLTCVLQMFSPLFLEKLASRKKLIIALCFFYRILLGLMVLIPIITDNKSARLLLLGVMYFTAYSAVSFINPAAGSWIISLVPEKIRGRYFGLRDMFILSSSAVLSLVMGGVLDAFRSQSRVLLGFIVVFSIALVVVVLNFLVLRKIKEPAIVPLKQSLNLKIMLAMPLRNEQFRKVVILNIVWNLTAQIAIPFFSVYMVTGLKLSYTFIMVAGIIMSFSQALSAKIWGKLSDKFGWEVTTVSSIGMIGVCHIMWMFVNHSTYLLLIPIIQIIAGIAWAGINLSLFNIQFKYAPQEGRTIFIGFNAALGGLSGFLSALIGATLIGALSGIKINIGVTVLDNMLFLFGLSGLLIVGCAVFASYIFNVKRKSLS
ncbi:MAG TPA: MFS transporter [Ruminiclostridium sp.]